MSLKWGKIIRGSGVVLLFLPFRILAKGIEENPKCPSWCEYIPGEGCGYSLGKGISPFDPRQWKFVYDANFDCQITISDFWLWIKWLILYPGDGLLYLLVTYWPSAASFLEIHSPPYGGWVSWVISIMIWLLTLSIVFSMEDS